MLSAKPYSILLIHHHKIAKKPLILVHKTNQSSQNPLYLSLPLRPFRNTESST